MLGLWLPDCILVVGDVDCVEACAQLPEVQLPGLFGVVYKGVVVAEGRVEISVMFNHTHYSLYFGNQIVDPELGAA